MLRVNMQISVFYSQFNFIFLMFVFLVFMSLMVHFHLTIVKLLTLMMFLVCLSTSTFAQNINTATSSDITEFNLQHNNNEQRLFQQNQQQDKQHIQDTVNDSIKNNSQNQVAQIQTQNSISNQHIIHLPSEQPCFPIQQIKLNVSKKDYRHFYFLQHQLNQPKTGVVGQCVGADGLQQILSFAQNSLIEKGFVTSRVIVKPQDLSSGDLILSIVVGKIANLYREQGDENINFKNALTVKQGDVLNLRELEQSVDNLKLPSHVQAKIYIEPTKTPPTDIITGMAEEDVGFTDLVVKRQKSNKLALQTIFNNYGNHSTGEYQAGVGLIINEPLLSNDRFYAQYMSSLNGINDTDRPATNENIYLNYQYPLKSWRFGLTFNRSRYTQALKGWNVDPIYKGISERKQLQVNKVLHRTGHSKLSAYSTISQKQSDYFIDDLEILVQKRKTTHYALGLDYELIRPNQHQFNVDVSMQKGSGAFKPLPIPERFYSDVDSRPLIWLLDSNYRIPFQWGKHQFGYNARLNAQYSNDKLSPNDQFTVGDRYTVRGFDGKRLLSGNKGAVIGQELYYKLPTQNPHQLYLALDKGVVSQDDLNSSGYHDIMGSVLGYRFGTKHINFDAYVGQPIQSKHLSNKTNLGVQIAFLF